MKYFITPVLSLVVGLFIAGMITWGNTADIGLVLQVVLIVSLLMCIAKMSGASAKFEF